MAAYALLQVDLDVDPSRLAEVDPIVWIVAGVLLVVLLGLLLLALGRRRQRRDDLRRRFGAEYVRAVKRGRSRKQVEEELEGRWQRVKSYTLRPLSVDERDELEARWEDVQATFVDAPDTALRQADMLLDEASRKRGYPDANQERRLDDLSVEHPDQVAAYREARRALSGRERATTDQQRDAFLKMRALFEVVVERGDAARSRTPEPPPAYEHAGDDDPTTNLDDRSSPTTSTADAAPATSPVVPPPAAPHPADPGDGRAPVAETPPSAGSPSAERRS